MAEKGEVARVLSAYEYGAVIGPGALFLYGVMLLAPPASPLLNPSGLTVGDLGVFLILAFVAGQILQSAGNLLETAVWRISGGWPTERLLLGRALSGGSGRDSRILNEVQIDGLRASLSKVLRYDVTFDARSTPWDLIYRAMYAEISNTQRTSRIDSFNRSYGMLRGITVALAALGLIVIVVALPAKTSGFWMGGMLLALSVVTGIRMVRFGENYAMELVTEFLHCSAVPHTTKMS